MKWTMKPAEFQATKEKIEKLNKRAAKRGFTGSFEITGETVTRTHTNAVGFEVTETLVNVEVTGEAPSYEGWTFLAALEWDFNAGLIVRTAPGIEKVDRDNIQANWCDHCETSRRRTKAFLVKHEDGRQLQVGSTCIKDFLGWDARPVFYSEEDVAGEIDDYIGGGSWPVEWATETVLAAAWAAIQVHGFVPRSSFNGVPTREITFDILDPPKKAEAKIRRIYGEKFAASYDQAKVVREWVLSDEFSGDNEYVRNLKAVLEADYVSERNLGFAVSAPQAHAKHLERTLVKQKEREEIVNEFVGEVGDRLEISVTIKNINYFEGSYGTTVLYTLLGEDKHIYKWFASRAVLGETINKVYHIRGTIKKHEEYRELKSTVLTRCKRLD